MKKIITALVLCFTFAFSAIDLNIATKDELTQIKGVGSKKADLIIEYRKKNKIENVEDLLKLKGFGPALIENIKKQK